MGFLKITTKGSWGAMEAYLKRQARGDAFKALDKYGQRGVDALKAATPVESSETANSWTYEVKAGAGNYSIHWRNTHVVNGFVVAIELQYGHGTGTGGFVQGRDYINPAIQLIFDQIIAEAMKEVTR